MKHILAACLFVALCAPAMAQSAPDPKPAAPEQKPAAAPPAAPVALTCVYNSKGYSDGAQVCVNKNLVLTCAVDSSKAVWNVATDKDAHDKCARPVHLTKAQRRAIWQRNNIRRQITRPTGSPPFCFGFDDGPLYCE